MDAVQWQQAQEWFHRLLSQPIEDRAEALQQLEAPLREEVAALLEAFDASEVHRVDAKPGTGSTQSIGPYRLVRELGEGGMGTVYLAERGDSHFEKQVAIKLIRSGPGSHALVQRFIVERQILAGMEHPNIARLLDGGVTENGQPYLVMDYVDGERLDKYCDGRKLGLRARLELFVRICAAVHYAHQNLVVHRDLKPSNILVAADGEPKLLDFGIAKVVKAQRTDLEHTATVGLFFTPMYASPELLQGRHTTVATDLYSLGVILYQLLSGRLPHDEYAARPVELMNAVITGDPHLPSVSTAKPLEHDLTPEELAAQRGLTPRQLQKALQGDLDGIVLKALAKTPAERYGSAEQFADDITRYLENQPVHARRQTAIYRAQKFVRRNWKGLAITAAALSMLVFAAGYAIRQQLEAGERLEQTRSIAKYLLFDLFDQVAQLPGSTAARVQMAERAQTELDRLSGLVRHNREVQLETAAGYNRLAQVYGISGGSNLGDPGAARLNLSKAKAMLEVLRAGDPGNRDVRLTMADNLLLSADLELWSNGNTAAAKPLIDDASRLIERGNDSDSQWLRTRAYLREKQGELADFEQRWRDSMTNSRLGMQEMDAWPAGMKDSSHFVESRARLLRLLGNSSFYQLQVGGALQYYQQTQSILSEANGRWPNRPRILAALVLSGYDIATTLSSLRRSSEALVAIRGSVEAGRQLAILDSRDLSARRSYFVAREAYAQILQEVGKPHDAIPEQEAVVEERRVLAARQPAAVRPVRDLAFSSWILAKLLWKEQPGRACETLRSSVAAYEALKVKEAITSWDWNQNAVPARELLKACR